MVLGMLRIIGIKEKSEKRRGSVFPVDSLVELIDNPPDQDTDQWQALEQIVSNEVYYFNDIEPCNSHCNLVAMQMGTNGVDSSSRGINVNFLFVFNEMAQVYDWNLKVLKLDDFKTIFDEETRTASNQYVMGNLVIDPEWSQFFVVGDNPETAKENYDYEMYEELIEQAHNHNFPLLSQDCHQQQRTGFTLGQ